MYDLYNPTIQKIEVLRLEKRLDDNLTYLQDCPAEYSTIPFDLEPVRTVSGATVPVNPIKVCGYSDARVVHRGFNPVA